MKREEDVGGISVFTQSEAKLMFRISIEHNTYDLESDVLYALFARTTVRTTTVFSNVLKNNESQGIGVLSIRILITKLRFFKIKNRLKSNKDIHLY